MNRKIKILFVRPSKSSFIQKDLELLEKHFYVKIVDFVLDRKDLKGSFRTLFKMVAGVLWADITFSWFADFHAFYAVRISKIFRKKSIVVVGGYEVAKVPEIWYGAMLNLQSARIIRYVLDNADKVLTVDDGLKIDAIQNTGVNGKNIQTVPTGYDYTVFKPKGIKENLIITVCMGDSLSRVRLKGLYTFVKSAIILPNTKFLIIGVQGEALNKLKDLAPSNVMFINQISQYAIIPYYQKAKVYCQLSMREGLPNSLCEAMLCECVPVGTYVQGITTAIGDIGFYVPYGNPEITAETIKEALKSTKGRASRERIKKMFPLERRERELVKIIEDLVVKNETK